MGRARIYPYTGRRAEFTATFVRYGMKHMGALQTALFIDVYDERGDRVSDHQWVSDAAPFVNVGVKAGDVVRFNAFVRVMVRGYLEHDRHLPIEKTYKLEEARDVRIVTGVGESIRPRKTDRQIRERRRFRRDERNEEYDE